MKRRWILILLLAAQAWAADPPSSDEALDKRVARVASELRCLVCQNQSLADSSADLAVDLRKQVRELIKTGKSDAEIRQYMVERYGDFVLYKPPLKATTALLWAGPFLLLVAVGALLVIYLQGRRRRLNEEELSPEERARAQALLAEKSEERS
jgi:cytochrome c-type biogenesis protein CcmH